MAHQPLIFKFPYKRKKLTKTCRLLSLITFILCVGPRVSTALHPPQCLWSLYQDIERLNCVVEPGNNLIVEEKVYGIGPERAKSLWVQCDPPSGASSEGRREEEDDQHSAHNQHQSHHNHHSSEEQLSHHNGFVLSHGVFMAVPNLRDLRIESCRITGITPGALSYLPYLQNLTIRAHTSLFTWAPSSTTLDIKTGVFRGLPELRHLDLSTTSLTSLPSDFLCHLPSLTHLNLTATWLRDFRTIGLTPPDPSSSNSCPNNIVSLDLSSNHFTLLPPATFAEVSKLEELRIDYNSITIAAERALLGLTELKVVSLAGNQLTSLPPEFFKDNRDLREIYLQNNSLGVLAPGLFSGLQHLVSLDISNNELTSEWVNGETFKGLLRLVLLNLANNELTKIDSALFRDLYSLQILNLENNKLNHIAEDAFSGMYNMHTLLLSHNNLKSIDTFICNGLFVLSFLALDNNKIELVEPESFKNCSSLQDLNLSGNKLKSLPAAISPLNLLRTLDLGENQIKEIQNDTYTNLPNLYGLRLTDNQIRTVSKDAFNHFTSLKIVNLAKNNITFVEGGAFDSNTNLQAVRLDSNQLSDIAGLFKNIPNLLWLNISANSLETINYEEFPKNLQWLDLRSNKISSLGNCLEKSLRIRNLDLSQNYLSEIGSSNIPDSIENLILNNNRISTIQPYTFFRKPNLTRVDLSNNQLVRLDQNALRLSPSRGNSNTQTIQPPHAEILLGNNPLQCDCTMEWLQYMNSGETFGSYPIIQDAADVKCTLAFLRLYEPISYMDIQPNQFLCKYESHCFSLCHCCDFDACDCEMTCPKNCSCYHDQGWGTNLVDCSMLDNSQQTIIPGRIPMDVTELYLDGNIFPSLDSHAFIGRKNLKALYLNASHIEIIQNRSFHGLKGLQTLHLENNFIERLEGFEFEDLESLDELFLNHNSISHIANGTFSALTKLRILWLHGNNFVSFRIWEAVNPIFASSLIDLTLRDNEWSCDCIFASYMKDWLLDHRAKISDVNGVQCVDQVSASTNKTTRTELVVVRLLDQRNHKCSQSTDLSIREPSSGSSSANELYISDYLPLILCLSGAILICFILSIISFYWRQSLRVWVHAKCGLRLNTCTEGPAERDKLFDAFVSYSSKDEAWVRQVLAAELERNDPPYRLCLRYRDLPTGGTYLADTIVQASEASRRTILVLSHHFLKGEWSRTDVKSAHHSVLKDRHRKVIIILLGDLPSKDLDPDIRLYLKSHTYLNCEDKRFWDKLHYALPDVKVKVPLSRGLHGRTSSNHSYSTHNQSRNSLQRQSAQRTPSVVNSANPNRHVAIHI